MNYQKLNGEISKENRKLSELNSALLEACRAWESYAKECENKIAPDYGYQRVLRDKAKELGRFAIAKAERREEK